MKDIYTPQDAAAEILRERRANPELRQKVSDYLGGILPSLLLESEPPKAILARYVPRATEEDREFADCALNSGLVPTWASYRSDRYTTRNKEKVDTVRPPIRWRKGQRTRKWIVDENERNGGIGELRTIYGGTSTDYQREVRQLIFRNDGQPELVNRTFDMGEWYKVQARRFGYEEGNLAPYYYPAAMGLYALYGVLFEDFDGGPSSKNGDLALFNQSVVYPAIDKVEAELGVKPVIVRLPYRTGMDESDLSFISQEEAEQTFRKSCKEKKNTEEPGR